MVKRVGNLACHLHLPPNNRIHPVFHVSLLRRVLNTGTTVETHLPHYSNELAVPVAVLQSRWRQEKGKMREQVLIRWSNSNVLGETWEDKASLKERFPLAEAWGQASTQEEGDVNSPDRADPQDSKDHHVTMAPHVTQPRKPNPSVIGPAWVN